MALAMFSHTLTRRLTAIFPDVSCPGGTGEVKFGLSEEERTVGELPLQGLVDGTLSSRAT